MTDFVKGNMIVDPALQKEVIRRAFAGNFGDAPVAAASDLGDITLPNGRRVRAYIRHAAEVVVVDGHGHIVLIRRVHNPGAGRVGLVGGFMDVVGKDGVETVEAAAVREAAEETGLSHAVLARAEVIVLGGRHYDRPFDIRQAWGDFSDCAIKAGDLFLVSTRTVAIKLRDDLSKLTLRAGDDARDVHVADITALNPDQFGVPDHFTEVQAVRAAMGGM
jgi:ADP-ribose pyrophosphatase YjhB (NUDIX family)